MEKKQIACEKNQPQCRFAESSSLVFKLVGGVSLLCFLVVMGIVMCFPDNNIDKQVWKFVIDQRSSGLVTHFMHLLAFGFKPVVVTALTCMLALLLGVILRNWRYSFYLLFSVGIALGIGTGLKFIVSRVRPPLEYRLESKDTASFPSQHTVGASALLLALLIGASIWIGYKGYVYILSALVVLGIGIVAYSRLYLGVHWLIDVLAGVLLGMASALLTAAIWNSYVGFRDKPVKIVMQ